MGIINEYEQNQSDMEMEIKDRLVGVGGGFWEMNNGVVVFNWCTDENSDDHFIGIDLNSPALQMKTEPIKEVKGPFIFENDFPTRSQILYRKGFYLTQDPAIAQLLKFLRRHAEF